MPRRPGGDAAKADAAFNLLAARKDAAFLGLRGLLQGAVARGDWESARRAGAAAARSIPARRGCAPSASAWPSAPAPGRRRCPSPAPAQVAALATAASEAETDPAQARRLAQQAWRADPAFTPAALAYARRLREAGREKRAQDVLRESWAKAPHPDAGRGVAGGRRLHVPRGAAPNG